MIEILDITDATEESVTEVIQEYDVDSLLTSLKALGVDPSATCPN